MEIEDKKLKTKLISYEILAVIAVWFSSNCGPGWASGTMLVQYFTRYGWLAPITLLVGYALMTIAVHITVEHARLTKKYDYYSLTKSMFQPWGWLWVAADIAFLLTVFVTVAASIASGAAVFNQLLGLNSVVSTVLMFAITVIIAVFGAKIIKLNAAIMTIGILVIVAFVVVLGLRSNGEIMVNFLKTREGFGSTAPDALWAMLVWCFIMAKVPVTTASVSNKIKTRKEVFTISCLGYIVYAIPPLLVTIMLLGFMPTIVTDTNAATLPMLYAATNSGVAAAPYLYCLLLFLALITTLAVMVFNISQRFDKLLLRKLDSNPKLKNFIISVALVFVCWLISQVGLLVIIRKVYAYISYVGAIGLFLPIFIFGIRNNRKLRRLEEKGELDWQKE